MVFSTKSSVSTVKKYYRRIYKSLLFPPVVIFVAILLVTYWSYQASTLSINRDQNLILSERQENVERSIIQRLATYEEILIGGAGLFRASSDVSEQEWHNYISTFDVQNRYPGVQSLGYIKTASAAELPGVITYMQSQGFDSFSINPATKRDFYTAILYNEPERHTLTRGFDLYDNPERKAAMDGARDSGNAVITKPLKPLQQSVMQTVFLMFVPQYDTHSPLSTKQERTAALRGYIFAGFRVDDFFNKLLTIQESDTDVALAITNASDTKAPFYTSQNYSVLNDMPRTIRSKQDIHIYGSKWQIDYIFNSTKLSTARRRSTPLWFIVIGSLFAFLLAEVIYLLMKSRARELATQSHRAVNLAKDELLSLASHQLRTPATTVKQYLGMVLQGFSGDISKAQYNLLQKAYLGNERQLRIINEMLHVARIDSGRITLAKQPTDLNVLLKEIVTESKSDAKELNHSLKLQLPKKPITLTVDDHMLRMAIENLVSNAIKYTLPGGKISVTMVKRAGYIRIQVRDNGVGIPSKDLPKLYQLFTRLNNTLTQTVSGTGVGLYLAKHLVSLHNGRITVTSRVDKGSVFTILLPYELRK